MRISLISVHASPLAVHGGSAAGGQNAHVAALATGLAKRGHEVVVHTRRDDPELPRRVRMAGNITVDHVTAGPAESFSKDLMFPYMDKFATGLRDRWVRQRPDVVHSHFWMSGYAAIRAAAPLGIPVVHTFHSLGVVNKREQSPADSSPPERAETEAALLRDADRVIATCSEEAFELLRLGGNRKRVCVVPCGTDTSLFTPDGPSVSRGTAPRVLYVGRLAESKGISDLVAALSGVPDAELVIVGAPDPARLDDGPDIRRLRDLADTHHVRDRVRFLGPVGHARLPELYRSADVVACVPWHDAFGTVPVEAMACGIPVVATAVGGLADSVIDNVTGAHVPPRRPDAITEALRDLLADPARLRSLGARGRQRAERLYTQDRMIAGTLRAYTTTAREARTAPGMHA